MRYRDAKHIPKGELIEVLWDDARAGEDGWRTSAVLDDLTPAEVKSVGYLHRVTRKHVVYANDVVDGEAHTSGVIPLGCIRRIRQVYP